MVPYAYSDYTSTLNNAGVNYGLHGITPVGGTFRGGNGFPAYYTSTLATAHSLTGNVTEKYRFAQFVWKLPVNATTPVSVNGFSFQLNNLQGAYATFYQGPGGFSIYGLPFINEHQSPVIINFRLDDGSPISLTGNSTPWINVTAATCSVTSGSTAALYSQSMTGDPADNDYTMEPMNCGFATPGNVNYTYNDGVLSIQVTPPPNGTTYLPPSITATTYVYLLVGLPMSFNISFDHVSAYYF
jgi:hypothetical protein